jgi:hypothetical protein
MTPSLSIFTIEADRNPVLAIAAKKHHEVDVFRRREGAKQTQIGQIRRRAALRRPFNSARPVGKVG